MEEKKPSVFLSLVPFAVTAILIALVIHHFGSDALGGPSQVALILGAGTAIAISMGICHIHWHTLEEAIVENLKNISSAIIILLLIGAIGGSWMVSGIVPTLIVYGLKVITPGIYLFAACLICALVSLMTGSSWTTIATIGVALIAIGEALGYSAAWCAGAIISGAYFGDKMSPLSDTTVLASSAAGVPLFEHIKFMTITTGPAFITALLAYLIVSILHPAGASAGASEVESVLRGTFNISPWLLLVPVAVGVMIWRKVPAILTLLGAALLASVAALIAQPGLVAQIGGAVAGLSGGADLGGAVADLSGGAAGPASGAGFGPAFRGVALMLSDSTAISTGSAQVDALVATGGMNGMLPTIFLIISAATFGGAMVGSGMIQSLTDALTKRIHTCGGLVGATLLTGICSNLVLGDQYLSIIMTSRLYKALYEKLHFEGRLLSRSTEDSATVTSVLIPWNSCGMTQSTVLRVPTAAYFPYCFFNILSPLCSLTVALIGFKIKRNKPDQCSSPKK